VKGIPQAVRRLGDPRKVVIAREISVGTRMLYSNFCSISELNRAAGLMPQSSNGRIPDVEIFEAMRDGFVAAGGIVTRSHLEGKLPFDHNLLWRRSSAWAQTLKAFHAWARREAADFPYMDDLASAAGEWRARIAARRAG